MSQICLRERLRKGGFCRNAQVPGHLKRKEQACCSACASPVLYAGKSLPVPRNIRRRYPTAAPRFRADVFRGIPRFSCSRTPKRTSQGIRQAPRIVRRPPLLLPPPCRDFFQILRELLRFALKRFSYKF